jgi:hypothetical protein
MSSGRFERTIMVSCVRGERGGERAFIRTGRGWAILDATRYEDSEKPLWYYFSQEWN